MSTITITGATGLVGANVAAAALEQGHTVRCTRRARSRIQHLAGLPIDWRDADLADPEGLREAFRGADAVIHCAAMAALLPSVTPELVAANVTGTRHVVDAVTEAGVGRLVHCSSTVAVGIADHDGPCDEDSPWNLPAHGLNDGYAITKHQAEKVVSDAARAGDIDAVVVNPTFMFGPYDRRPSSGQMILEVASGRAVAATKGVNDFVDVRDVAQGMLLALEKGRSGERYILSGQGHSYREIFTLIAGVVGRRPPRFEVGGRLLAPVGWVGDLMEQATGREQAITTMTLRWGACDRYRFTSAKAERELGYRARPVEEGVRAAWDWFQAQGMAASR